MAVKFVLKNDYNNNNPDCPTTCRTRYSCISCTFGLHDVNLKYCTTEVDFMSQRWRRVICAGQRAN